jgi:hypothetical protein
MCATRNIFLSVCLTAAASFGQSTAGQDIKDAGSAAKDAAVKTGSATAKVTKKGAKKTGRAVKKGSKKAVEKTGAAIEKGGEKIKDAGK